MINPFIRLSKYYGHAKLFRVSKQLVNEQTMAAARAAAAFGAAAGAVDQAAASTFGVNHTDLRIIGTLNRDGARTAGQVAAECGLSPAATTTAIQRLVTSGHVTRVVDSADRRRAIVALTPAAEKLLVAIYGPIGRGGVKQLADYTPVELNLLTTFLERGAAFQQAQADRIRLLETHERMPPTRAD
jgi:DNA-binding MarR family transcriptional regulator